MSDLKGRLRRRAATQKRRMANRIGQAFFMKKRSFIDRLLLLVVQTLSERSQPARGAEYMRDDIVDAEIEFSPAELEALHESHREGELRVRGRVGSARGASGLHRGCNGGA